MCVCVCILYSQSLCCQKASSALIAERRKREGGTDHGARDDQGGLDWENGQNSSRNWCERERFRAEWLDKAVTGSRSSSICCSW